MLHLGHSREEQKVCAAVSAELCASQQPPVCPALVAAGDSGAGASSAGNHSLKVVSWARDRQVLGSIPPAVGDGAGDLGGSLDECWMPKL